MSERPKSSGSSTDLVTGSQTIPIAHGLHSKHLLDLYKYSHLPKGSNLRFLPLPSELPQPRFFKALSVIMVPSGVPAANYHWMPLETKPRKGETWVAIWINLSNKTGKIWGFRWKSNPKWGHLETSGFIWGQLRLWDSLGRNIHIVCWKLELSWNVHA